MFVAHERELGISLNEQRQAAGVAIRCGKVRRGPAAFDWLTQCLAAKGVGEEAKVCELACFSSYMDGLDAALGLCCDSRLSI
jgi:hypothetical protein